MLRRTQARLLLTLVATAAVVVAGLAAFQLAERGRVKRLLASRVEEENANFDKLLELKGASLRMFAVDYT
ncbi:hypothetical protein FJY71_04495 [candidate division WOR-3 bacterium]|nr:hypothetical protein [candidate division WOR-3 bacterium]